jgi:para-nitrobenzyl esterase
LAKGLFHKAIIQSAGSYLTATPIEQARAKGVAFAKAAGCGEGADEATADCLRKLPVAEILKLAGTPSANSAFIQSNAIRDGQIVVSGSSSAFREGRFTHMPVLNGTNRDEGGFFTALEMYGQGTPPWNTVTHESTARMLNAVYGTKADAILARYPAERFRTAQLRSNAIQSDAFVCKSQHATELLAGKVPLYTYEFRDRTAPSLFPDMPGFEPLAYHSSELQYLFPGFHGGMGVKRPLNAQQEKLSDRMVTAWTNFVRTGNPGGKGIGTWPAFDAKTGVHMGLNLSGFAPISNRDFAAAHQCDFWQGVLSYN